jgi:membrane protein DedA with SNARE-associated domain
MEQLFEPLVAPLNGWIDAHRAWAGPVVFAICFLESLALVSALIPATIMLIGIGALVAAGALDFWTLAAWGSAGAGLGFWASYEIGARWSARILAIGPVARRPELVARGHELFARWGAAAVFVGRFIGVGRVVVPLMAGTMGVRPLQFHVTNWLSALIWAPLLLAPTLIASWTTAQIEALPPPIRTSIAIVLIGLLIAGWRAYRRAQGRS